MLMSATEPLSLRRNISWTFIGNIIYAASQWGMIVVLTKLGTQEMVGQFALGLAVTAPVVLFTNLQLRSVQATDIRLEYSFEAYRNLRILSTVFALLVISGIAVFSTYTSEVVKVVLAVGAAKAVESISDVYYGSFQRFERMDWISQSLVLRGLSSLVAVAILIYFSGNVLFAVVAMTAVGAMVLFLFDIPHGRKLNTKELVHSRKSVPPRIYFRQLRRLAMVALPLGVTMMFISLNSNIPKYFIEGALGVGELGVFAALSYVVVAGHTVVSALGQSGSPRLARYYSEHNYAAFYNLLLKFLGVGLVLGATGVLVAAVAGKQILTIIYGPQYATHHTVFLWLMGAGAIGYVASFMGYGMTALRYFKIQAPLFAVVASVAGVLSFFLIPEHGLLGAAIAMLGAGLAQLVLAATVTYRGLRESQRLLHAGVRSGTDK